MKRAVIWIATIVIGSTGAFLLGRLGAEAKPQPADPPSFVGFEPDEIDLGRQLWGTHVPVELLFVNDGSSEIAIQSVKSSCDCVVIDAKTLEGEIVVAGESLVIPVTLETGQYPGEKQRTIELHTASEKTFKAKLNVNIIGTWHLTPSSIDLGEIQIGDQESSSAEGLLTFVSETDHLIGNPEIDVPWLECYSAVRDNVTTDIMVRADKSKLLPGVSTGHVVLHTSSSIRPDVSVYVRVKAISALMATPSTVYLVGDESRVVHVRDRNNAIIRISSYEVTNDTLIVQLLEDGSSVRLSANPGAKEKGKVKLIIKEESGRTATVIVYLFSPV